MSHFRARWRLVLRALAVVAVVAGLSIGGASLTGNAVKAAHASAFCGQRPQFCTELQDAWSYNGHYTGHDEPSLLFYSTSPGSGNSSIYRLTLPKDPPTLPKQDGTGGTWNFQLHPAFWFGMIMCDDQSAPTPGKACPADSDQNIYTGTNSHAATYLGNTPGQGFMEMQFYPPGWAPWPAGNSCDPTQWCAALNIDSVTQNANTGVYNNSACLNAAGVEYVNFAFITKSGVPQPNSPPDPVNATLDTYTPNPSADLFMSSGDTLSVDLHDTPAGFQVVIHDLTTGQTGSMTASAQNGFGHPLYQPNSSSCNDQPYTFHPMFNTSSPKTRVLWAAHSYNVAYSDEIGHFEYCKAANRNGACTAAGASESAGLDTDDFGCFNNQVGTSTQRLVGCIAGDNDFDGPEYAHNWPGSNPNAAADASFHASPITFTSPVFNELGQTGQFNYAQVAFEADMPRIEGSDFSPNNNCQRHLSNPADPNPGAGCVNPPNGASFYPIYSAVSQNGSCVWQEGDAHLPNTINNFGGSSTAEYGALTASAYPSAGGIVSQIYENFHNTLSNNPCPASGGKSGS